MSLMFSVGLAIFLTSIMSFFLNRKSYSKNDNAWDEYANNGSPINKALTTIAKPWAGSKTVLSFNNTKSYEFIDAKLKAGNTFSANVEIFLSVQIASIFFSCMMLASAFFTKGFSAIALILFSIVFAIFPFQEMISNAEKRTRALSVELPDFAELFLMVAPTMSIPAALSFTAERSKGVVSVEISELVKALTQRTLSEADAFELTSRRIGTPDGRQFIAILEDGYINGSKVVEQIKTLTEQMRRSEFQRKRGIAKKLPVKLVIIFAIHFMPLLLGLAFLPVIYGLSSGF